MSGSATFYIGSSGDDGYWDGSITVGFWNSTDRVLFGHDDDFDEYYHAFFRFPNVTIPKGATITSAYLTFTAYEDTPTGLLPCNIKFRGNDTDDAVAPTSDADAGSKSTTSADVNWDDVPDWTQGNQYTSPSLVTIVQEIVNRFGWASGNAMMLFARENSSESFTSMRRVTAGVTTLYVSWTHSEEYEEELSESIALTEFYDTNMRETPETVEVADEPHVNWEANVELPGGGTGFDAHVVSLLHCDGENESEIFTDETGKDWVKYTFASLSTTQKKFGTASLDLNSTSSYAIRHHIDVGSDFELGTGPFTFEFWTYSLFSGSSGWIEYDYYSRGFVLYYSDENLRIRSGSVGIVSFSYIKPVEQWYHLAVTRDSESTVRLFADGVLIGTVPNFTDDLHGPCYVYYGKCASGLTYSCRGYMDEMRVSNVCRWTEDFDTQQGAYRAPTPYHTIGLIADISPQLEAVATQDEALTTADDISVEKSKLLETSEGVSSHASIGGSVLKEAEISENLTLDDETKGIGAEDITLSEGFTTDDLVDAVVGDVTDFVSLDDDISPAGSEFSAETSESVELGDTISAEGETGTDETVELSDSMVGYRAANRETSEDVALSDAITLTEIYGRTAAESAQIWDKLGFTWNMTVEETLGISETVKEELVWKIKESLIASETLSNLWSGTVTVQDMLTIWGNTLICEVFNETAAEALTITDTSTFVHKMISSVAEALGISEVVTPAMTYNPLITEALGVVAAVTAIRTTYLTNSESLEVTDNALWQWQETVAESLEATDAATLAFRAILALTESLEITETVLQTLQVNETLAEALDIVASLTAQYKFNLAVEDTLTIGLSVLLDDEVWQCWVLNGNQFNPSVYSGFDFNSYAVFGNAAYGCRTDGIYELTGATDQGTAITAGIVLPDTWFGTNRKKRFRKAYFGLSGGTTPSIRLETDSGSQTYTISDSRAAITRNLYGRTWTLKLQGFQDLDFIELCPVILTR